MAMLRRVTSVAGRAARAQSCVRPSASPAVLSAAPLVAASHSAHVPVRAASNNPPTLVSLGADSFLSGTTATYAEEMYRAWLAKPDSVHASWAAFFSSGGFSAPPQLGLGASSGVASPSASSAPSGDVSARVRAQLSLVHLVRAYQVRGHEVAVLDPLGLRNRDMSALRSELDASSYGFSESQLDASFDMTGIEGLKGFLGPAPGGGANSMTLRELLRRLQTTYCGTIGWEYMHITSREKCNWIRERVELAAVPPLAREKRLQIFDRLAFADQFERFLANKFNTAKRFGLEGAESLIPGLKAMIDRVTELGVKSLVFGMPHRGRLNVLVNVFRKPMEMLLKEFQGTHVDLQKYNEKLASGDWSGSGDVKYHLGTSCERKYPDGRSVHLALLANPSHLEAVNSVVTGKVRAKQDISGDHSREAVLGVLLHGDAAFAGQGIIYDTFLMSQLKNYGTGGTVHVVVNNQVGFTTDPEAGRSTLHCSDIGKAFDVPIFHVNADDPEAVVRVFEIAGEYRQRFKSDVIVDLVGYRRHGHNEVDQPAFTQPLMYAVISKHLPAVDLYHKKLAADGVASDDELKGIRRKVDEAFAQAWTRAPEYKSSANEWLTSRWKGFHSPEQMSKIRQTGLPSDMLRKLAAALVKLPEGFRPHPSLAKGPLKAREEMLRTGEGIDWATAESLAFGSLMAEGNRVRLSGQDVERGTFSHRHAVLHDHTTNQVYVPLAHVDPAQAPFLATNSPLSEFGVMGFELGYAMEAPDQLVLWEAQFGDFVNGAQIMIDQFLASGETKWFRQCGLTLLLPHGYEGQGPEHSSARIERFLQAVDDQENLVPPMAESVRMQIQQTNMQVVNCSTPANYFHVLRRQVHRGFRKPLVIATPKSLLRHKMAVSKMEDMAEGTKFKRLIPDAYPSLAAAKKVRKVLFCSGKVYYELAKHRQDHKIDDVAIARVEQIAPFPFDLVAAEIQKYPNASVTWVQEEPRNMGAWFYVWPRIMSATRVLLNKEIMPSYAGRLAAASPAAGAHSIHEAEQSKVVADAFA